MDSHVSSTSTATSTPNCPQKKCSSCGKSKLLEGFSGHATCDFCRTRKRVKVTERLTEQRDKFHALQLENHVLSSELAQVNSKVDAAAQEVARLTELLQNHAPDVLSIATESLPVSSGTPDMERVRSSLSPLRVGFPPVFDVQDPPAFGPGNVNGSFVQHGSEATDIDDCTVAECPESMVSLLTACGARKGPRDTVDDTITTQMDALAKSISAGNFANST